jgi:thiamine biosynthesis lipoprotein
LLKAWGFFKDSGYIPSVAQLQVAESAVGWRNLLLNTSEKTVRFARPGVEIDPGGIGKGYAVDQMAKTLRKSGVRSALISAASSSIYAIGAPPGKRGWKIELSHPDGLRNREEIVWLRDESVSTSGTNGRSITVGGQTYGHIMDPRTGYPLPGVSSVSILAPKTIDSEAWGKPYLILGREWAQQHKPNGFRIYFCSQGALGSCSWIS